MAASKNDVILYSRPPKGQLILKANFEVSSEPKTVRIFFVCFCHNLKKGSNQKDNGSLSCLLVIMCHLI